MNANNVVAMGKNGESFERRSDFYQKCDVKTIVFLTHLTNCILMNSFKKKLILLAVSIFIIAVYYSIFVRFIPNKHEMMGHDYAFYLPALLDGYFFYHINGLWGIPWFTPSFCGGSLNYVNINNGYYTIPQFITFFTNPVVAVRFTFLFFAGLGFTGFYMLLRRVFFVSIEVSFFGAVLFLFNGFYAHRVIVGHLGFHSFMLIPLIAFFILYPIQTETKQGFLKLVLYTVIAGLCFAYMVQSGLSSLILPSIISIVLIGIIHGLISNTEFNFWRRLAGSGFVGIFLSLSKLTATFYLMKNFSRSGYKLPGTHSFLEAVWLMLKSLFLSPAFDPDRMKALTNVQWYLTHHEWEYSVTPIPLIIILYGCWKLLKHFNKTNLRLKLNNAQWLSVGVMVILLVLPVALNTFSPKWNVFLKQIPLIKNSSNLIRWFSIYIPIVILLASLILEKAAISSKYQPGIIIVGITAVVFLNAFTDHAFYNRQNYNPDEIVNTYYRVKSGEWTPEIKYIGVYTDKKKHAISPIFRNNALVHDVSQLLCYEPMFGYRLEFFPIKTLHQGPALDEKNGVLNIKNPACYVWPETNNCEPGDQFTIKQKDAAMSFLKFRPFLFQMPLLQIIANWINILTCIFSFLFIIIYTAAKIKRYLKFHTLNF